MSPAGVARPARLEGGLPVPSSGIMMVDAAIRLDMPLSETQGSWRRPRTPMAALKSRNFCAPGKLAQIERLVSAVVQECYGHLIQVYRFDVEEDWPSSWPAEIEGGLVGVLLTSRD